MEQQKKEKKKVVMPYGLRNKLMAAVAMLLVSSIMMVSSTFAWFTLSTAPEIKGISTSVGANGNLEMALLNKTGDLSTITSAAGDSTKELNEKNLTWGNLVNLDYTGTGAGNYYGLDKIQLMPARLAAATTEGVTKITAVANLLNIPSYGNDGRVDEVNTKTVFSGTYEAGKMFKYDDKNAEYGVRAIGVSGDMTAQQAGLFAAKLAYKADLADAQSIIQTALKANMQELADAVIAILTGGEVGTAQSTAIGELITATGNALDKVDAAYGEVVKALVAGAVDDANEYATVQTALKSLSTYSDIKAELDKPDHADLGITIPENLKTAYSKLSDQKDAVAAAKTANEGGQYKTALYKLVNVDKAEVNGYSVARPEKAANGATEADYEKTFWKPNVEKNTWELDMVKAAKLLNGITVEMLDDSGVFAYVGQVAGDYSATSNIDVTVKDKGLTATNVAFTMRTKTTPDTNASGVINGVTAAEANGATLYITDTYGYVIDLAFRTNAADSTLQLASNGVQRIYDDATNEETLGAGSTMTFKSTEEAKLDDTAVAKLMETIRVVFFNPEDGAMYGVASLKNIGITETKGEMKGTLTLMDYSVKDGKLKLTEKTAAEGAEDLMALTQNTAAKMSVLVYLDGDLVDNSMVGNAAQSITGSLNLQFKSDATLQPMQNSALKNGTTTNP